MIVAIIGLVSALIGLLAAIIGRRRHITNRQEIVNRQEVVHIEQRAEPQYIARCHDCGQGIQAGQVHRRTIKVGTQRYWKRGFLGIGGRWEYINNYAKVDLCPRCAGTRTCWIGILIIGGIILFILAMANAKR
jgi:hypothetical protein